AIAPARLIVHIDADERERHSVLIRERQDRLAKTVLRRLMRDSLLDEAVRPIANRAQGYAERGLTGFAHGGLARGCVPPGKEGQDSAGTGLVAKVEVIGQRI